MESIKVLIVEDSFIAARVLKQLIDKHEGVVCSIVSSGKEAIERVKSECFSVILMDISLGGGLDGAITTREIRDDGETIQFTTFFRQHSNAGICIGRIPACPGFLKISNKEKYTVASDVQNGNPAEVTFYVLDMQ